MIKLTRFTAPWCAPCRMLAPVILEIEKEHPEVEFTVVDVDATPETAQLYNIRSVPTVMLFKNDEVATTLVGAHPKKVYVDAIRSLHDS